MTLAVLVASGCSRPNPDYVETAGAAGPTGTAGMAGTLGTLGTLATAADPSSSTGRPSSVDSSTSAGDQTTGSPEPEEPNPCCVPAPMRMGCDADPEVELCVCDVLAECCDTGWGAVCGAIAVTDCDVTCPYDCCFTHESEGCSDPVIEEEVCDGPDTLPLCCEGPWTDPCVESAVGVHGACRSDASCCFPGEAPGCASPEVTLCMCAIDPFCCIVGWDDQCAMQAPGCGAEC